MPRKSVEPTERAKTRTFTPYPDEWEAIKKLTRRLGLKSKMDLVRLLVWESGRVMAAEKKSFREPREKKTQS